MKTAPPHLRDGVSLGSRLNGVLEVNRQRVELTRNIFNGVMCPRHGIKRGVKRSIAARGRVFGDFLEVCEQVTGLKSEALCVECQSLCGLESLRQAVLSASALTSTCLSVPRADPLSAPRLAISV